ncbi:MAG: serine protease [Candidatus Nanopelagicales bacterium]|jgi:hypothetical protein|nr:serine protease [Candidatus Nanopelagicales bacterium]
MSDPAPDAGADLSAGAGRGAPGWSTAGLVMVVIAALLVGIAVVGLRDRAERQSQAASTASTPGAAFDERQGRGTSLPAVGRLRGLAGPCTAWLLAPVGLSPLERDDAPAHVLTAGRCAGIEDSATVLSRIPVEGAAVEFALFSARGGGAASSLTVPVVAIAWASVRGTDLAVLRLAAVYGGLADQGIPAIEATAAPVDGQQILVAGVPVAGVPSDEVLLRGSRCQVERTTDLADGPWVLRDTAAIGCGGILEGSFGSPALDPAGRAVGLVAASTIGAIPSPDCAAGRPCEVGEGSIAFRADTSYLVGVAGVGRCLTLRGLRLGGQCPLEVPSTVVEASIGSSSVPAGSLMEVRIAEGSAPASTTLVGMLGATDCWAEAGRRPAVVDAEGVLRVRAPTSQGLALLCVGSARQPTPLRFTVAGTAPDAGAIELRETPVTGGLLVAPVPDPPDFSTFVWTTGPPGTTDCATAEGYQPFTGEPAFLEAADLPTTVCVIASDAAGTASAPQAFQVG